MQICRLPTIALPLAIAAGVAAVACFGPDSKGVRAVPARTIEPFSLQPDEARTVKIFREASPAVVFISSSVFVRRGFFSRNVEEIPYGTGSGFIWDKLGHVVTNYHVVRDFIESGSSRVSLSAILDDQSSYKVEEVVGTYKDKEIAVLRIDAPPEKLQPIRQGTSRDLQVGQTVLAIGNPFGLDRTLTVGIVSALGREIQAISGRRISGVIQTDAAINPGNSGGPLLNSEGQLIGMNTAILSPSGADAGIGFAIPCDSIRRYADEIIANKGRISNAGLGVGLFEDDVVRPMGLKGVLIREVFPRTAAEKAGLHGTRFFPNGELEQLGDIITAIGDDPITDFESLRDALEKRAVGDEVEVTILRDKKETKVAVKLQKIKL